MKIADMRFDPPGRDCNWLPGDLGELCAPGACPGCDRRRSARARTAPVVSLSATMSAILADERDVCVGCANRPRACLYHQGKSDGVDLAVQVVRSAEAADVEFFRTGDD